MPQQFRIKILHVLAQRPDSTGSGIYLQSIMREAAACGHDNFMVAGIQSDSDAELQGVSADQCRFIRFNGPDIPFPIPGMTDIMPYPSVRYADLTPDQLATYETVFKAVLTEVHKRFQPDIIHTHHLWIVTSLVRRLFPDTPIVATCHGTDLRQFNNCPHLREKVLSGCSRLDAAMALSAPQKKDIESVYRLPAEKVTVTGAGYNDTVFSVSVKPAPPPVQIVYAGKLWNAKGLPWLLKALQRVRAPAWQLHMVGGGKGKEKEDCLRLARELGGRVLVHGQVPQARLAALFRQSHLFVLPSLYEGLPLVLLEALACGCRLIATKLPGVMEVVGGVETGFISLVQTPRLRNLDQPYPEDLPAFEQNLARALDKQISAAVRSPQIDLREVADRLAAFTWKGVFAKVQQVYAGVL
jgi:glycosyltransferase involved in cell wall biosynthesis